MNEYYIEGFTIFGKGEPPRIKSCRRVPPSGQVFWLIKIAENGLCHYLSSGIAFIQTLVRIYLTLHLVWKWCVACKAWAVVELNSVDLVLCMVQFDLLPWPPDIPRGICIFFFFPDCLLSNHRTPYRPDIGYIFFRAIMISARYKTRCLRELL